MAALVLEGHMSAVPTPENFASISASLKAMASQLDSIQMSIQGQPKVAASPSAKSLAELLNEMISDHRIHDAKTDASDRAWKFRAGAGAIMGTVLAILLETTKDLPIISWIQVGASAVSQTVGEAAASPAPIHSAVIFLLAGLVVILGIAILHGLLWCLRALGSLFSKSNGKKAKAKPKPAKAGARSADKAKPAIAGAGGDVAAPVKPSAVDGGVSSPQASDDVYLKVTIRRLRDAGFGDIVDRVIGPET
jgi:hypothetical protein